MTTIAKRTVDVQEVQRAYDLLVESGQVIELRVLDATTSNDRYPSTYRGYFDNPHKLLSCLSQFKNALGFYMTLQQCDPELINRDENKVRRVKGDKDKATSDKNITRYNWLLIDCDPARAEGISSTDEEHAQAFDLCQKVRDALVKLGWPLPILANSGNGWHLLYKIDLPVHEADLVKRVLAALAEKFDQGTIHIDQTVYNPARICKLYGTLACKGDNTARRPHRLSRIVEAPEPLEVVSPDQLVAIATPEGSARIQPPAQKTTLSGDRSLQNYLDEHSIPYEEKGGKFILKDGCPFDPSHSGKDAAVFVRDGKWCFHCFHDSCATKSWQDFRLHFEPGAYPSKENNAPNTQKEKKGADDEQPKEKKGPTTQELLRQIAETAEYIVTPGGDLYARVPVNGHHEVVPINERGSGFRRWLVYQFDKKYGHAPNSEAISQVMSSIQAKAAYEGKKAKVYTRIAEHEGNIYLDLANDLWQCVKITPDSWEVITKPPVSFRRSAGMLPLPVPKRGGDLDDLRKIINTKDDKNYILIRSWLIGALHPTGPYPVLNLNGERGSAKSKTTAILRNLLDPNEAPTRDVPKDKRDAAIAAQNTMVFALDNLSSMPLWLSDLLCRLSTGSGSATRALYTDDGEKIFSAARPIIINGIEDSLISQGDLLNRTMLVKLKPPEKYKTEEEIDEEFKEKHPGILGALLTLVSVALRERKTTYIENPPRMADFARWVTAAEKGMSIQAEETFLKVYEENQKNAESNVIESSPLAQAIIRLMEKRAEKWEVLISKLHDELMEDSVFKEGREKLQKRLSGPLARITPSLRSRGIDITAPIHTKGGSQVTIIKIPQTSAGDENPQKGDDGDETPPAGDEIKSLSSPHIHHDEMASEADSSKSGDNGDNKIPLLSASSSQFEQKNGGPDEVGKLLSPLSPTTSSQSAQLEQVRLLAASIGTETIRWAFPDNNGFPRGDVSVDEYCRRIQTCLESDNPDTRKEAAHDVAWQLRTLNKQACGQREG